MEARDLPRGEPARVGLLLVALAASLAVRCGDGGGEPGPATDLVGRFENPGAEVQPIFRWWWPGARVDHDEIVREVEQIADAGFGGVEIADVWDSAVTIDPVQHGYGTEAWNAATETALRAAKERGLQVDLTIGPHWPSVVPSENPEDVHFAREIAHGLAILKGGATHEGAVPEPVAAPRPSITRKTLLAVQAVRCSSGCSAEPPIPLDQTTLVDLTPSAGEEGRVSWTAPPGGEWVILTYWERATGQRSAMYGPNPGNSPLTDPDAYVVDHFSQAGTEAVKAYWESTLLTPAVRALLRDVGGAVFEDSLELQATGHWTPGMLEQFEKRRGYSLQPFLASIIDTVAPGFPPRRSAAFTFTGDVGPRVRHDYEQTLSDLWLENRIEPLREWTHTFGMHYRNQGYGLPVDSILSAATTDIPEGESLGFGENAYDAFRALAAGRDLGSRRLLSDEVGAYFDGAYGTTWRQMLSTINANYAGGVNQMVLHGFAYADAPNAAWPGFQPFSPFRGRPGFAEGWGPRQPTWRHIHDISGYLARTQGVLQGGISQVDVAVYRQTLNVGRGTPYFADEGLAQAGYSYGFVSHGALRLPSATVEDRRLAPNGPAYRALVLDDQSSLPLQTAQTILGYAQAGLPIVVVGTVPSRTPGYLDAAAQDAALQEVVTRLLAGSSVRRVETESDVPAALRAMGVRPAAENAEPSRLLNVHRAEGEVDFFYFYNPGAEAADVSVSLAAAGQPYALDAWSGRIEPMAVYGEAEDRTEVRIRLAPEQTTIIAVTERDLFGRRPAGPHVTTSEAPEALFDDRGELLVRATASGSYATALSDGRTIHVTIADVPEPQTLSTWHLSVEDWQPGRAVTETRRVAHELDLDALAPWTEIPGLEDVSGVGRYRTEVTLAPDWDDGDGAYLDLGEVVDTVRVTVNGRRAPPVDPIRPVADVGSYLKAGANTIEVEVASTLSNRLRVARPAVFGKRDRQACGLVGPVRLVPYGEGRLH